MCALKRIRLFIYYKFVFDRFNLFGVETWVLDRTEFSERLSRESVLGNVHVAPTVQVISTL